MLQQKPTPSPAKATKKRNWIGRHPLLTVLGSMTVLIFVIAVIGGGGGGSSDDQSGSSNAGAAAAPAQPTDTPQPPYRVVIRGSITNPEFVGSSATLDLTARNQGRAIPHLVLGFDGLGSWVINSVQGCNGEGHPLDGYGNPYDFGPVSGGGKCHVTLDLVAKTAGNPTLSLITYANVDSNTNTADVGASVDNSGASVEWTPSINP